MPADRPPAKRDVPVLGPAIALPPATPTPPPAAPPALRLRGRSRRGHYQTRHPDDAGNLRPDGAHGVGREHGHDRQAANQDGSDLREDVSRHGYHLVMQKRLRV